MGKGKNHICHVPSTERLVGNSHAHNAAVCTHRPQSCMYNLGQRMCSYMPSSSSSPPPHCLFGCCVSSPLFSLSSASFPLQPSLLIACSLSLSLSHPSFLAHPLTVSECVKVCSCVHVLWSSFCFDSRQKMVSNVFPPANQRACLQVSSVEGCVCGSRLRACLITEGFCIIS